MANWQEFPIVYSRILDHFLVNDKELPLEGMKLHEAQAKRREFYRFISALETAEDEMGQLYHKKAKDLIISITPSTGDRNIEATMVVKMNPSIVMLKAFNKQATE